MALKNLIALGEQHGLHFDVHQTETVITLATDMGMLDSPWVAKLRQFT